MSNESFSESATEPSFWRPNNNPLPGSARKVIAAAEDSQNISSNQTHIEKNKFNSPDKPSMSANARKPVKNSASKQTFQQYERDTEDAWDDGDDDLLVRLRLDTNFIQSTANQVISNHNSTPAATHKTTESAPRQHHESGEPTPAKSQFHKNGGTRIKKTASHPPSERELTKQKKFEALLNAPPKNLLDELRTQSWAGIPHSCRPITWKILSGYLPPAPDRRTSTLQRKREEYLGFLEQYFGTRHEAQYKDIFRQISIDVPRMNPLIPLFQTKLVQEIFERILYIWAIRHPASGYVQGINDLVTPFFVVFLTEFVDEDVESGELDITVLSKQQLDRIEADSYWCMSKLLDGIQDNYTFAQPGIQTKVSALKELTLRIDAALHNHIEKQGIEFLQFTFRWMNNLLMRELPLRCTIRLWDTYLAEPEGFADYHLYVCAAFLTKFSKDLKKEHDFQGLMTLLQNLPTHDWGDGDIGELTAEAYKLKYMYAGAPQHYKNKS